MGIYYCIIRKKNATAQRRKCSMPALVNDLTSGDVTRKLIRYALPLMASSLLQATYSITDIIVAGHFIGDVGITAINNGSVVMNLSLIHI